MSDRKGIFTGDDPFVIAKKWLAEAETVEANDPNAIALSTVDASGMPNARMVLLKEIEASAFVFYTNYESAKAAELESAGKATLLFSWLTMHRQIRIVGTVTRVSPEESDAYFASRPRGSQLGAWASPQSDLIADPSVLEKAVVDVQARFGDGDITRPPFWGGYRVAPVMFEFWQGRPSRLHDRLRYVYRDSSWHIERIAP
jgi:pyridoxamine 5'-phosphate oxidase